MKLLTTFALLILTLGSTFSQTKNDTIFNYKSKTPITVDGQAGEDCWANAEWHNIDQVWIPYNASMKDGDFEGRFKVSWDEEFLYVLVEVVDDLLSDDHSNPLQNWWDDDCLEIFIDEDRSMGNHEKNCNAFAYHMSLIYDAIDLDSYGKGINYKNNVEAEMDTIGTNTYLWEFAIKNYDASFNINNAEASRVYLSHNKLMGFAIAYCDNDETTSRENFIGSMEMPASNNNDMYKNADYFGPMILVDPEYNPTSAAFNSIKQEIKIYPVPAKKSITIETREKVQSAKSVSISTISGQIVMHDVFTDSKHNLNIQHLENGIYILNVNFGNNTVTKKFIKQ